MNFKGKKTKLILDYFVHLPQTLCKSATPTGWYSRNEIKRVISENSLDEISGSRCSLPKESEERNKKAPKMTAKFEQT